MTRQWGRLVVILALAAAGCSSTTVGQVVADPSKYRDRTVTVRGTVAEGASILGRGAYRITDKDHGLWVVTTGGVPRTGARVDVTGRVQNGYDLAGLGRLLKLPKDLQSGTVLVESSHKVLE
jgi:hypothetical protein